MIILGDNATLADVFLEEDALDCKAVTSSLAPLAGILSFELNVLIAAIHGESIHPESVTKP